MTFKEFDEKFIKSDKTFFEYGQGCYWVRGIKVPLTASVFALYGVAVRRWSGDPYNFHSADNLQLIGYIDCHQNVRFPNFDLCRYMLEDNTGLPVGETSVSAIQEVLQKEVVGILEKQPLPEYTEDVEWQARQLLFETGSVEPPELKFNFTDYISDSTVIDYLAETDGWAEKIIDKWRTGFGCVHDGKELDQLEMAQMKMAWWNKVKEVATRIKNDPEDKIHKYIAMKKAVEGLKTVTVRFKTCMKDVTESKVPASAFRYSHYEAQDKIHLYVITPNRECARVKSLLPMYKTPNGNMYKAECLYKDEIVAILYRGKVIWPIA